MGVDGWISLCVVAALLIALIKNLAPTDLLFLGATAFLSVVGIITPEEAFAGFSNSGVLTVGFLFVVVAAVRETGVLNQIGYHVLGQSQTEKGAIARLSLFVAPMSAFLNNTPIVAMFVPIVTDWCQRNKIAPSKLLIPLSYLTILGGTCTLVGTSTNLVVNGLMVDSGMESMGLFEIGAVGLPLAIVGIAYLWLFGQRLLPARQELLKQLNAARREYLVEMLVQPNCRLTGLSVETAGLRHLPELFLIEIDRVGQIISPVRPDDRIQSNDRLIFTGVIDNIIELEKIPGLVHAVDFSDELTRKEQHERRLCEAVISESSSLVGRTIRDANFRAVYGAAVVAVHRFGKRIAKKIGDIELQMGDTLLLQTRPHFLRVHGSNSDFFLVSGVEDWRPIRRDRAWVAIVLFVALVALMTTGVIPIVTATALAAILMVVLGCLSANDARKSVEWNMLITIAASFGIGSALQNSGAATIIAGWVVESTGVWGPIAALAAVYVLGSIITELITNNAAAVLMFPFCLETARLCEVDARPFVIALAISASASFMTPIGYQTNMMVYGPGGYHFLDFMRIGAPLNVLLGIVAVVLIPLIWPF